MRTQLQLFLGCKRKFSGRVTRFGLRHSYYGGAEPTVMLKNVTLHTSINIPIDHLWLAVGKRLCHRNPRIGDVISFNGWVREYHRFNARKATRSLDYCVARVSALELLQEGQGVDFQAHWGKTVATGKFVATWPGQVCAEAVACTL